MDHSSATPSTTYHSQSYWLGEIHSVEFRVSINWVISLGTRTVRTFSFNVIQGRFSPQK